MPQLVRIAHDVHRPNHVPLDLECGRLHRSLRCIDDDTGQAIDHGKAHRKVVAPPRAGTLTRDTVKIRFMAPSVSMVGRDRPPECDMGA
jgi:hypothetical protein